MRKAYNNYFFIEEEDSLYGVSLGFDFCAEHEWGTKDLREKLGIKKNGLGAVNRQITNKDSEVIFLSEGNEAILITKPWNFNKNKEYKIEDLKNRELNFDYSEKDLVTAWDGNSFGVLVRGEENIKKLTEIHNAFKENDILLTHIDAKIKAFSNSSLSILIKSRLPEEILDSMYKVDQSSVDLIDYEKKIGIAELREKFKSVRYKENKYFCACSPKWINYDDKEKREEYKKKINTKYDIEYWINYSDNDDNYGWYTAEEILKWFTTPGLKLTEIRDAKKERIGG